MMEAGTFKDGLKGRLKWGLKTCFRRPFCFTGNNFENIVDYAKNIAYNTTHQEAQSKPEQP